MFVSFTKLTLDLLSANANANAAASIESEAGINTKNVPIKVFRFVLGQIVLVNCYVVK